MKRWLILAIGIACLTGCRAEVTEDNLSKVHFVKADLELGDKTPEERAWAIKQRLGQIEQVRANAVIVEGHTAIIGLRLAEEAEQNTMVRVKKEADQAAREADRYIESTSITMNGRIVSLIEEMERRRAG